jgi:hypothetical protein
MGWGLLTSLCLTLFIIPAMLMTLEDIKGLFAKTRKKVLPRHRSFEDAVAPADEVRTF